MVDTFVQQVKWFIDQLITRAPHLVRGPILTVLDGQDLTIDTQDISGYWFPMVDHTAFFINGDPTSLQGKFSVMAGDHCDHGWWVSALFLKNPYSLAQMTFIMSTGECGSYIFIMIRKQF